MPDPQRPDNRTPRPRNRGPAAAAGNRASLVAAARKLFAAEGYRVPLSAIAREAGVGQGVLYRHFPDRLGLALAVFAENIDEVERLAAAHPGVDALAVIVGRLIDDTLGSSAFVDAVVHARAETDWEGYERLLEILDGPVRRAAAAGRARADLTVGDVGLLVRAVHGISVTQPEPDAARAGVDRLLHLLDPLLARSVGEASGVRLGAGS